MAPLDAVSDLSIYGSGQAIGGARARGGVTATSQTQRRAWASRWARCSFLRSCRRFRDRRIRRARPRRCGIRLGRLGIAHRWPIERKTMGIMHEAVEDSVGEGRIADDLVPGIDRQLAGDQRRAGAITVLDDLHEVAPLVGREPVWAPVIKNQQI